MNVTGIIAEFNPFHNGHKYLIDEAKKITNSDFCIAIMSGNFTQNGNIAIYDKFKRAKIATQNGIDMVIELPTIYAISSSEYFATGCIDILNKLNIVDSICFGSECGDIDMLEKIANCYIKNELSIWTKRKELMKKGVSFALANQTCMQDYLEDYYINELNKSNNILGIDYIKAIKKLNSNIIPYTIKRLGTSYNSSNLSDTCDFTSATSIREKIITENLKDLKSFIPIETQNLITVQKALSNEILFNILKYTILVNKTHLNKFNGVIEGLENKIIDSISISKDYNEFIHNIKSKRYAMSSIKRMLLSILLNITKEDFNKFIKYDINYAHVLSISNKGKKLLSEISKKSNIKLLTNINNDILSNLNDVNKKSLELDILASNIYHSLLNEKINKDYTNRL